MQFSLLLLCACAAAGGAAATHTTDDDNTKLMWSKQVFVLEMLQHLHQADDVLSADLRKLGAEFQWTAPGDFGPATVELVNEFRQHAAGDKALRGRLFTIMDENTIEAVRSLVRLFYYAQDWATFQRLAVWSRLHINEGMFAYAFSMAIQHRADMADVVLPALHETFPHLFYASPAIEAARHFKMQAAERSATSEPLAFDRIVRVNYTSDYAFGRDAEAQLDYFTEDVGLNEYYMYAHHDAPFWLSTDDFVGLKKPRRGELFLYQLHSLLARYHLERLSHGLGPVADFSFYQPIEHGYDSMLVYADGQPMPARPAGQLIYRPEQYERIERFYAMERRVRDAIDLGRVQTANGSRVDLTLERLGNLMQANPESENEDFYEPADMWAHELLGGMRYAPGVLQHYETSMRDPMFYRLYAKLLRQYRAFVDRQPEYTADEVHYPNVRITGVEMDTLNTTFGEYRADLSQAVYVDASRSSVHGVPVDQRIQSVQRRLQHDHFGFRVLLEAKQPARVLIKTFLGPKTDNKGHTYTLNEMRENFYEIDEHVVNLTAGKNVVERNCAEIPGFASDRRSYTDLYEMATRGLAGTAPAGSWPLEKHYRGFPLRLMLPRGQKSGLPVQFFFYVMSIEEASMQTFEHNGNGFVVAADRSFGFPLDRKIDAKKWRAYENMYTFETKVFHREH